MPKKEELQSDSVVKKFFTTTAGGKISHDLTKEMVENEYHKFYQKGLKSPNKADKDFDEFTFKQSNLDIKKKDKK